MAPFNVQSIFGRVFGSTDSKKRKDTASSPSSLGSNVRTLGDYRKDEEHLPPPVKKPRGLKSEDLKDAEDGDYEDTPDEESEDEEDMGDEEGTLSSDAEGEGQKLGNPHMEVDDSDDQEYHEEEEDGEIIKKKGAVPDHHVEKAAHADAQLKEVRAKAYRRHQAFLRRQYVDGVADKDKTEQEITGVEQWGKDRGFKSAMKPDSNGDYRLIDEIEGVFEPMNGEGPTHRRIKRSGMQKDDKKDDDEVRTKADAHSK